MAPPKLSFFNPTYYFFFTPEIFSFSPQFLGNFLIDSDLLWPLQDASFPVKVHPGGWVLFAPLSILFLKPAPSCNTAPQTDTLSTLCGFRNPPLTGGAPFEDFPEKGWCTFLLFPSAVLFLDSPSIVDVFK